MSDAGKTRARGTLHLTETELEILANLELFRHFVARPTVHHNYIRQDDGTLRPSAYTIRVGSTSGPEIGNIERIQLSAPTEWGSPGRSTLRFTPHEGFRGLFPRDPMELTDTSLRRLKAEIAAELRQRSLELAGLLRMANRLERPELHRIADGLERAALDYAGGTRPRGDGP